MEVKEVSQCKKMVENNITELIQEFENETGCVVAGMEFKREITTLGGNRFVDCELNVRIK